jgi:hypothetical protein
MADEYVFHVHGINAQVAFTDNAEIEALVGASPTPLLESIRRRGNGTAIGQNAGHNWVYLAIPAPTVWDDTRPNVLVGRVILKGNLVQARITQVEISTGATRLTLATDDGTGDEPLDLAGPRFSALFHESGWSPCRGSIRIAVRVDFEDGGRITFEEAAAAFRID